MEHIKTDCFEREYNETEWKVMEDIEMVCFETEKELKEWKRMEHIYCLKETRMKDNER